MPPGGRMSRGYMSAEEKAALPKITWPLIKRVFSYLTPYWKQFVLVLVCIVLSSVMGLLPSVLTGKIIDEEWYMTRLMQELDKYKIKCITYDPWGMWNMLQKFGRYQSKLMEYQQSIRYMSVPTKWLESAMYKNELNFLGNPIFRWNMKNVVIYIDPNANIKLDKARSRNKIDGVVACVDALGGWLNMTSGKTGEIYATHGLRTVSIGAK